MRCISFAEGTLSRIALSSFGLRTCLAVVLFKWDPQLKQYRTEIGFLHCYIACAESFVIIRAFGICNFNLSRIGPSSVPVLSALMHIIDVDCTALQADSWKLERSFVVRSAVLFVIGEFDRRFTQRLRRSPYIRLTLANELNASAAEMHCISLLAKSRRKSKTSCGSSRRLESALYRCLRFNLA